MTRRAQLQTARLTLRPVAASDEAAVLAALNDLDVTGWLSVVPYPYTATDFHHFLTEIAKPGETFAVDDAEGFAGIVGAGGELGYWFCPRNHGRGYATEAARAVLAAQLAETPDDVASGYFEGNARSANVLRKLGFVETGRGPNFCRALGVDRPHVDMRLTAAAFRDTLPIAARSARLAYRPLQPVDRVELHALVSHWDVVRQLGSYPWPADPTFTATRAQPYHGAGFAWGNFLNGRLIGTVAVTGDELGYMLLPELWRQGYVFEACQTALATAFADPDRGFVLARVWSDNAPSLALLRKLGFRVTADDLTFSKARQVETPGHLLRLDRADWRPRG